MRTTDWNSLGAMRPVDRVAALAAAFGYSSNETTSEEEILLRARNAQKHMPNDATFVSILGQRHGRLTVVAYLGGDGLTYGPTDSRPSAANSGASSGSRWLCRCVCGGYRLTRNRAWNNGLVVSCVRCENEQYQRGGKRAQNDFRASLGYGNPSNITKT